MSGVAKQGSALGALRHRDFRLIAIGNMVSQLGFWGQYVAVGWTARELTDSDFMVTVAFGAQWLPALFLSSFAGVAADRYDRRTLVMWGNMAMVLPPAVIGVLIMADRISLWSLIGLVLLGGAGQAFTQPATAAFVPALVPPADLHSAVALNSGMTSSTRVIGPAIAGAIIAAWGVAWGFNINAISFFAVSAACVFVRARPVRAERAPTSVRSEMKSGLDYTRRNPAVARLLLLIGFEGFWVMHSALMPMFARDVLHGDASTYGLLSSGPGIGFVIAAVLTTALTSGRQRRAALRWASFGTTASMLLIAGSREVWLTVTALGLFGVCWMTLQTLITTMLVAATDDEYRGRVMGLFTMVAMGVFPINSVLAGLLSDWLTAPGTVYLCAGAVLVFNIVFFTSDSMKIIEQGTEHPPEPATTTSP
ncbi:MAG: MFS transporter [Actinomycetota bacterium]|nr:MFS transporter [Actinomycetota bacterium]